ncbi:MAG: trypsin-like peptidase domain-containing protein [Gemmataceae bacterium]
MAGLIRGTTALLMSAVALLMATNSVRAQQPVGSVAADVNKKLVKVFGAGGFKGLPSYGTGILVSAKGYVLTVNNHILSSTNLRVHLYDGRVYTAKLVSREPEFDLAIIKIENDVDFLPHYDVDKSAVSPIAEAGDLVFAHSNCFQIATRDEPMSVQRGVVAAYTDLRGRRGVFDAPFNGEVYFIDTVANNPGAAGGALTNRKGDLLGIIGRELKNTLTDTWINYAVPIQSKVDLVRDQKTEKVSIATFVKESIEGKYKEGEKKKREDKGGYHGIILVANAITATPPYVEEVAPDSPASKAGLKPDDLIVYVDGNLVPSIRIFRELMKSYGPEDPPIRLEVQRGNRLESITLKLTQQPKSK